MSDSFKSYVNSIKFGLPVASTALCLIGTLANLISLVYFMKKNAKTLGDKMLMSLNCVDLILCICATVEAACMSYYHWSNANGGYILIIMICLALFYILLIDGTAYITCLLSVTRAIGIASPFYQIKGKLLVILGITAFVMIEFIQIIFLLGTADSESFGAFENVRLLVSILIMLTVVFGTIVAVYKLMKDDLPGAAERVNRNNRRATWTVVILSVLFLVFNSILLGVTMNIFVNTDKIQEDRSILALSFFCLFLAIPLNSAINPIVYITRRSDMRQFFVQNSRKFSSRIHGNE